MKHWERVKFGVRCAYGCDIKHPEWVYIHGRFAVCESCAGNMGIRRPVFGVADDAPDEPHGLVPATPARRDLTAMSETAETLKNASTFEAFMNRLRRLARS